MRSSHDRTLLTALIALGEYVGATAVAILTFMIFVVAAVFTAVHGVVTTLFWTVVHRPRGHRYVEPAHDMHAMLAPAPTPARQHAFVPRPH